jgi:hypothetical protein
VLEVRARDEAAVRAALGDLPAVTIGEVNTSGRLRLGAEEVAVTDLAKAWRGPLAW